VRPKKVYFTFGPYFAKSITRKMYDMLGGDRRATDIFRCLVDYYGFLPRGQQWMIPLEQYRRYVEEAGNIIEAFASPFNSQLLKLGVGKFCSIGEHDGECFGSLGSFFNLKAIPDDTTIIVNPPFVEEILLRAAIKCLDLIEKGVTKIIFYGPCWRDSRYYQMLSAVPAQVEHLKKLKHYFEGLEGEKIGATFESVIFTLKNEKC
jgi:hypothetical protein